MSSRLQYLQCIKGWYRFRRRWPHDVECLATGQFFIRILHTGDLTKALALRPEAEIEFFREVERLRSRIDQRARALNESEVKVLFADWFTSEAAMFALAEPSRYSDELHAECLDDFGTLETNFQSMLRRRDYDEITPIIERFLMGKGVAADVEHPGYRQLVELMVRGWRELARKYRLRLEGEFDYEFRDADVLAAATHKKTSATVPLRTLADLIDSYWRDKEEGWSQSSQMAYQPVFRLLRDVLGPSRTVASIKREDGRRVFDAIKALPTNLGKRKALAGLGVLAAIERNKTLGLPTIGPKTINGSYLSGIKAMFVWAQDEQWIDANPFDGFSVIDPVHSSEKRDPFSSQQLQRIFTGEPWTNVSARGQVAPIKFWGPLIALFMGMRRGEIAQLDLSDVVVVRGVNCFLVRPDDEKRVKTKNARRMLPIHSELIKIGLLGYVERQRRTGQDQLFTGQRPNNRGQWGDSFGDWFQRHIASYKFSGAKLGMHSYRHNFEDALREADLHGGALGQYLSGRTRGGDAASSYGAGYSASMLAAAIEKVEYPDLDLSHLHTVEIACAIGAAPRMALRPQLTAEATSSG